jgi:hypothetical protein
VVSTDIKFASDHLRLDVVDTVQIDFVVTVNHKPVLCAVILQTVGLFLFLTEPDLALKVQIFTEDVCKAPPKHEDIARVKIKVNNDMSESTTTSKGGDVKNGMLSTMTMGPDKFLAIKEQIDAIKSVAPAQTVNTEYLRSPLTRYKKLIKRMLKPSRGNRNAELRLTLPVSTIYAGALAMHHQQVVHENNERLSRASRESVSVVDTDGSDSSATISRTSTSSQFASSTVALPHGYVVSLIPDLISQMPGDDGEVIHISPPLEIQTTPGDDPDMTAQRPSTTL